MPSLVRDGNSEPDAEIVKLGPEYTASRLGQGGCFLGRQIAVKLFEKLYSTVDVVFPHGVAVFLQQ